MTVPDYCKSSVCALQSETIVCALKSRLAKVSTQARSHHVHLLHYCGPNSATKKDVAIHTSSNQNDGQEFPNVICPLQQVQRLPALLQRQNQRLTQRRRIRVAKTQARSKKTVGKGQAKISNPQGLIKNSMAMKRAAEHTSP